MKGNVPFHEQGEPLAGCMLIQPGNLIDLRSVFQALVCTFFHFADSFRVHMYIKSADLGIASLGLPFSFKLFN
ncbi:hypothetical protein D3C72_1100280 [compost metagenome]